MTLILMLLTFVATTATYAGLLFLAFRRVARHLQGSPDAMQAVTEHVLVPLLGKKQDEAENEKPVPQEAELTEVQSTGRQSEPVRRLKLK
jgi:hypothetical protein